MEKQINTLRLVVEVMNTQRRKQIDRLHKEVISASVPLPLQLVEQIAQLNPSNVREAMMGHPGYQSWEALESYRISTNVFHIAFDDLIIAIDQFEEFVREGQILHRSNRDALDNVASKVQKEIFSAANAAHSLVDHSTRRLQRLIGFSDYTKQMKKAFLDDGLHDFIIGLRTIIHHIQMHPANWSVRNTLNIDPRIQATFQFDRETLLLTSQKMNKAGRSYLENASNKIDVREVFKEYQKRTIAFHDWFLKAIDTTPPDDLRDYQYCLEENKKMSSRTIWKAMIGIWVNWKNPPNPYDYLDQYLTSSQRDAVNRLPMRSREQVDQIIDFVDIHSACDEELRELVYRLFMKD